MPKTFALGTLAVAAMLAAALFGAVPPGFIPDSTFQGSSLKGWTTLGQADWRADKGEIIATPKSPAGGWLMLDKSYQDVGFFSMFRCTGDCRIGVLLRAQKTETGTKGIYVSLTKGEMGSYRVTLDAHGLELSRELLKPPSGGRFQRETKAPPAAAGGPRRPAPAIQPDQWNAIQILLDADVVHSGLGFPNRIPEPGESWPGRTGTMPSGATNDEMGSYGPIALYAGGSGEVHFQDVAFKDLARKIDPEEKVSSNFRLRRISDFYYAWCTAVADINHDGIPDVVAPPFYYLGPNFTERREFMPARTYNVSTEYTEHMIAFAHDFTSDGWPDIAVTKGGKLFLYLNPKGESRRWDKFEVAESVSTEIELLGDIDADGMPDVLYGSRKEGISFASPDRANPTGTWKVTHVSGPLPEYNAHGLGMGDINGDGRIDVVAPSGWWEQPAKGGAPQPWAFHAMNFGWGAAEMSVYDVNGDGLKDVVTPLFSHGYGISWFEQKRDAAKNITFVEHSVMGGLGSKSAGNVVFSQLHASTAADLDGDGIPDFIVGKRVYSHQEAYGDADPYGPAVLYWYRTVRNPKAPGGAEFVPELIHNSSGVGSHFVFADLNKDGALDIITTANRGTFIFFNRLRAGEAKLAPTK